MCNLRQWRRVEELPEQRETRLDTERESKKRRLVEELPEQRENRLATQRDNAKRKCAKESQEQRENRLEAQRNNAKRKRAKESQEQREDYRLAFRYSQDDDYTLSRCVQIGTICLLELRQNLSAFY